jgi:tetratricopeptide (TPR) repeat protein
MTHQHGSDHDAAYRLAQDCAASGDYSAAIAAYSAALDTDPGHVRALVGRGLSFQRLTQHLKAVADFDEAISRLPDWSGAFVAYYGRATSEHALRRYVEAVADCDEALARKPDLIDALYLRGIARKALGQIDEAIADMNSVLEADPSYHEAYRVRGSLHLLQQRFDRAIDDFTTAIERGASDVESLCQCHYLRGMAAQELGRHRAAIADFGTAIDLVPDNAGAYLRRSRSYAALGESALADSDLQIGTRLVSVDERGHRN